MSNLSKPSKEDMLAMGFKVFTVDILKDGDQEYVVYPETGRRHYLKDHKDDKISILQPKQEI